MPKRHSKSIRIEKRSLATAIDLNYKEQEDFVSSVFLGLKVCFTLLAIVSLIKIGHSSKVRLTRLRELKDSYLYDKSRFDGLSRRFDDLISLEGEQRFMKGSRTRYKFNEKYKENYHSYPSVPNF